MPACCDASWRGKLGASGSGTQLKRSAEDEAERAEKSRIKYEIGRELLERFCVEARRTGVELKIEQHYQAAKNERDADGLEFDLVVYKTRADAMEVEPDRGEKGEADTPPELLRDAVADWFQSSSSRGRVFAGCGGAAPSGFSWRQK
eukprot:4294909-Amphidinium_carterae.1